MPIAQLLAGYTRCAPRTLNLRSLLRADGATRRGGQDVRRSEGEGILVMRSSWRLFGLQACALSSRPIITAIPTPLPLLFPGLSIDERGTAGASHVSGRHADPQALSSSVITHHESMTLVRCVSCHTVSVLDGHEAATWPGLSRSPGGRS